MADGLSEKSRTPDGNSYRQMSWTINPRRLALILHLDMDPTSLIEGDKGRRRDTATIATRSQKGGMTMTRTTTTVEAGLEDEKRDVPLHAIHTTATVQNRDLAPEITAIDLVLIRDTTAPTPAHVRTPRQDLVPEVAGRSSRSRMDSSQNSIQKPDQPNDSVTRYWVSGTSMESDRFYWLSQRV
jgi:hypothetical protein